MCSRTTCFNCKKPTWSGCGNHIEIALAGVPKNQRCKCTKAELAAAAGANTTGKLVFVGDVPQTAAATDGYTIQLQSIKFRKVSSNTFDSATSRARDTSSGSV